MDTEQDNVEKTYVIIQPWSDHDSRRFLDFHTFFQHKGRERMDSIFIHPSLNRHSILFLDFQSFSTEGEQDSIKRTVLASSNRHWLLFLVLLTFSTEGEKRDGDWPAERRMLKRFVPSDPLRGDLHFVVTSTPLYQNSGKHTCPHMKFLGNETSDHG